MSSHTISTEVQVAGIHCWPEAPESVAFLRNDHRHLFTFVADVVVSHEDRAVEFFCLQRDMHVGLDISYSKYKDHTHLFHFGYRSCEKLAQNMCAYLQGLGYTILGLVVHEDGESSGCYFPADV